MASSYILQGQSVGKDREVARQAGTVLLRPTRRTPRVVQRTTEPQRGESSLRVGQGLWSPPPPKMRALGKGEGMVLGRKALVLDPVLEAGRRGQRRRELCMQWSDDAEWGSVSQQYMLCICGNGHVSLVSGTDLRKEEGLGERASEHGGVWRDSLHSMCGPWPFLC